MWHKISVSSQQVGAPSVTSIRASIPMTTSSGSCLFADNSCGIIKRIKDGSLDSMFVEDDQRLKTVLDHSVHDDSMVEDLAESSCVCQGGISLVGPP